MPISFACPHCGLETHVADQYAGQSGPCARCGQMVTIPTAVDLPASQSEGGGGAAVVIGLALLGVVGLVLCAGVPLFWVSRAVTPGPVPLATVAPVDSQQAQCANNLRRLAMAMQNYHDTHNCFPPAVTTDKQGKPMHSWRALLLPYVDPGLPQQYDMTQPWDSPKNRALASRMPAVFRCPADPAGGPNETNYVMVTGKGTVGGEPGEAVRIADITDGTSNTVTIIEVVGAKINWLEPRDLNLKELAWQINSGNGKGLSSNHPAGVNAAFADGAVHVLPPHIDRETLRRLLLRSDGQLVDPNTFQ